MTEIFLDINPEPWALGKAYAMRGRGGAGISPNKKLVAYQKAVREALEGVEVEKITGPVQIEFFFSRTIEKLTYGNRKSTANYADVTNLQKALEDALQGILYENDNQVRTIRSTIVSQSPDAKPGILIIVYGYPYWVNDVAFFEQARNTQRVENSQKQDNSW